MKEIEIEKETRGSILILRIKGRLDTITSPAAERQIFDFIGTGQHHLLLDFKEMNYLSSAGMRMLLSTAKKLKALSGKLVLCSLTENVGDILRMSGFDHVLAITKSEEEALKNF
jgi:anti-anti-sigma factor